MYRTFEGCSSLIETPNLPEVITNLERTFYGCSSLTKAPNIPKNVTNMKETFMHCFLLSGIMTINATNLSSCPFAFSSAGTKGTGLTVIVPNETARNLLKSKSYADLKYVSIVGE